MRSATTLPADDRAVSSAVTHALALGITAILMSGLLIAAGTMLDDQRENSAREELRTVGHRIADDLTRAAALAQDGGNVTIETRHRAQIAGKPYHVRLLTGTDCQSELFTAETCLHLELQDGRTDVMVPVRNETEVTFDATTSGTYVVSATRNASAPAETVPAYDRDLRVGVGDDVDEFDAGSTVDPTNRDPIAGFTFTPGRPTVDSVVHFQNDTDDLDGQISDYEWDLGDGTTKSGVREFNHSFSSPGKYTVTLTVTDDDGATDNVSKVVSVGGLVYEENAAATDVSPSIDDGAIDFDVTNKHGDEVTIREVLIDPEDDSIDWLDAHGGPDEIVIDAGTNGGYDGDEELYDGGRIYDLVTDGEGAAALSAGATSSVTFSGFAETEGGPWRDMHDEPVFVAMHYEVGGQYFTAQFTLFESSSGNDPPEPAFTYSCTDRDCDFDGTGSDDSDGSIEDYAWTFGDGNSTSGSSNDEPSNVYPANGTYDVSLTVTDDDGVTSTKTVSIDVGGDPDPVVVWAVNSGGSQYTDSDGITYDEDTDANPHEALNDISSQDASSGDTVANTSEDPLYQTERYGEFDYDVDLPDGEYQVRFKLAEFYWNSDDDRVFDVSLEGTEVISNLDVYEEVGHDYALWRTHTVTVSDGQLDIDFRTDVDNAKSGAIVVRRLDAESYQEDDGSPENVSMEAENYMGKVPGSDDDYAGDDMSSREWIEIADTDASDDVGLEADGYGRNAGDTENGERLDYYVDFENTGTYNVWVRMECPGGNADSVHVGLDGTPESYGDVGLTSNDGTDCRDVPGWTWVSDADGDQVTVDVTTEGQHTFNLWMREDGTRIDKIVLKKDGTDPSGTGPAESDLG